MLKRNLIRLGLALLVLVPFDVPAVFGAPVSYNFSYSGRLTESNGRPLQGPVALSISFYRLATGGTPLLTVTDGLNTVPLQEGIFQVSLALSGSDFHQAFPSVFETVYVEITDLTNRPDRPYDRQLVAMVPYAAKIPVDDKTVTFDSQGRATLAVSGTAGTGKLLSADGSGGLAWIDQPSATVSAVGGVSAANVATGATAANAASNLATASTIVKRDSNGGFSADNVLVSPTSAVRQGLIVKGATAQSASLQEWQDTNGAVLTAIDPSGALKFKDSDGTANYVGLKGPASAASNVTYTLPAAPVAGYYLQTDASGVMSWASPSGAGNMNTSTYDTNANGVVDTSEDGQKFANGSGWAGSAPSTLTTLSVDLAAGATTATVASTTDYPTSGLLLIGAEVLSYSGKTATTFTGLTRGVYGTTDALHASPASVGNILLSAAASSSSAKMVVSGQGRMGLGTVKPEAVIEAVSPSNVVTQINRGAAGQTFDLQQWQASDGTILSAINKDGGLELKGSDTANYVALKAGAGMSGNISLTLPAAQGAANSLLTNNGAGVLSWSTASIPASGTLATLAGTETLTNKTLTAPTITAAASVGVRDSSAAFDVNVAATSSTALSAGRTLTVDVDNGSRTLALKKNLTVDTGNVTLTGQAGGSSVTLPPSGTLATLAGTETLTNKTLTAPTINGGTMNGELGTAGAPSYSFTGDLDTGIWSSGANTMNLSTAGSERLRIDSSGRVGIGTTSPSTLLDLNGDLTIRGDIGIPSNKSINGAGSLVVNIPLIFGTAPSMVNDVGTALTIKPKSDADLTGNAFESYATSTAGSPSFVLKRSGNVGIGTTTPTHTLTVTPNGGTAGQTVLIQDATPSTGKTTVVIKQGADGGVSNLLEFRNSGNTVLAGFDQGGTLAFGQIARPQINTSGVFLYDNVHVVGANTSMIKWTNFGDIYTGEDLFLGRAGTANLRIGNVPANPPVAQTLSVQSASGTDIAGADFALSASKATGNAVGGSILFQTSNAGASGTTLQSSSTKMTLTAAGNVGIGTTSPAATLNIKGTSGADMFRVDDASGNAKFIVDQYGAVSAAQGMYVGGLIDQNGFWALTDAYNGLSLGNDKMVLWNSGTGYNGTKDIGLARNAAGVVEINNGTAGQYRDLQLRSINPSSGNVGIGTTSPTATLEVNGGVRLNTATAKPTCDATQRGTNWVEQGGAGVTDKLLVCLKSAADTYSWIQVTTGG